MLTRRIDGTRDEIDQKLVELLCTDARMTLTALAQKSGLSRTAVQGRLARLERDRVVVGYRAVLGERCHADTHRLKAILSLTFTQRPCATVVRKFQHWPEIVQHYSVTGEVDAYAVVSVDGALDLAMLLDRLSAVPGVGSVRSALVLKQGLE